MAPLPHFQDDEINIQLISQSDSCMLSKHLGVVVPGKLHHETLLRILTIQFNANSISLSIQFNSNPISPKVGCSSLWPMLLPTAVALVAGFSPPLLAGASPLSHVNHVSLSFHASHHNTLDIPQVIFGWHCSWWWLLPCWLEVIVGVFGAKMIIIKKSWVKLLDVQFHRQILSNNTYIINCCNSGCVHSEMSRGFICSGYNPYFWETLRTIICINSFRWYPKENEANKPDLSIWARV